MILNLSNFTVQAAYPDLTLTDPRKKNKAFIMQWGRAFITNYLQSGSRDFYNARTNGRYEKAKLYALGEQEVKAVLKDEQGNPDRDPNKVDLRKPLKLLKKSLRAVDGKLKDHDFVATVTPIDATAQDERLDYESRLRVWMAHGEFLQSLGIPAPGGGQQGGPGGEIPVDEDELALHMDVKYRHRDAMLLEMKLALALYLSNYAQVNRHCLRDETTYGSSVVYLGLRGPRRLPARLHPGNCFFLPSDTEDYANLQAGAHIEKVSLAQVLQEIEADPDTTLSATDRTNLESLAKKSLANGGYNYYYDDVLGGKPELAGQLEVVRFSFKSYDAVVMKEYTNKFGNPQVREKPATYQGGSTPGKVHRQTFANWYEGSLIVGSDIGYGCRKCYEQLRDEDNPFDCHPLYVVTSPDMLGGHTESVVEQCMVLLDTINEAFARLRFKAATLPGSWIEFDLDAIENGLIKGSDGKATGSVEDAIRNFFRNGYIIGRKQQGIDEGKSPSKIVDAGQLARDAEIQGEWMTIQNCSNQIAEITGINGSIAAADPGSRQSVGTTQLAIQGAENTLEYLYFAKQSRFERVARALAVSIKQSEARAPLTGPVPPGFEGAGEQVVGTSPTITDRVFQCRIERKPTEIQWQSFYEAAKVAMTQKEVTLADYTFLMQVDNLKQAWALLSIRAKRNQMQAAESAQQQTSMASQQQQESAKVTGEETRRTNAELHQQNMELQTLKNQGAIAANEVTKQGALDLQELTAYFKTASEQQARQHEAEQAAQQREMELAQHDGELSSSEGQADLQRQHEAQLASQQQVQRQAA